MSEQRFEDLSKQEIAELSDAQVERWVDIECAFEGAPLLPICPEEPVKPNDIEPDMDVWKVGDFVFSNEQDAYSARDSIAALHSLGKKEGWYSNERFCAAREQIEVKRERVFSEAFYNQTERARESYDQRKETYDKERNAYDRAVKARGNVNSWVWGRVHEAREFYQEEQQYRARFEEYKDLANGSVELAYRFLLKSYPDFADQHPDLADEFNPMALEDPEAAA